MGTALVARFPLGTYQAHRPNGQPDEFPDVARLFSALVAAAGTGSTAAADAAGGLRPSTEAIRALQWLEHNPPDGLALPDRRGPGRSVVSFRQDGVVQTSRGRATPRIAGRDVGDVVSFAGPVAWTWNADPPDDVGSTLDALCADVAYLGESGSPVVLEFGDVSPTHRLDVEAGPFAVAGERVRVPTPGRLDELELAYRVAYPRTLPTRAQDGHKGSELPSPASVATSDRVVQRRYVAVDAPLVSAPWRIGWLLPASREIEQKDVVGWCVAMHRAFVARVPDPVPALITGRFVEGQPRPANRFAIQYIAPRYASLTRYAGEVGAHGAFVVALPIDATPEDEQKVRHCLVGLTRLYDGARGDVRLGAQSQIDATQFWTSPMAERFRLWRSVRALVPETRLQRKGDSGWSLADAAALSVAFVARDRIARSSARGQERYRDLVAAVGQRGVRVGATKRVADSRVERYAHKLPESLVAQPYLATLALGDLWDPCALVMLGQSRHLGGGLLAPLDVDSVMVDDMIGASSP